MTDDQPPEPAAPADPRLAALAAEIRARDAELVQLRLAARAAEEELRAVRASTSWRITAPLRAVVRRLRGG